MDYALTQRGRALLDWEVSARLAANRLQARSEAELAEHGVTADTLPEDMNERHELIDRTLENSPVYAARGLLGEWCARNHGLAAQAAFDEIRERVVPELDALARRGPTTITVPADFKAPNYYSRTWFHRTAGGWDAGDYNGFVHSEIVRKRYTQKVFPSDQARDRRETAQQAPRRDYHRILEIGTSSGYYTLALSEVFPQAEIWGIDPSLRMLEQAQRVANEQGLRWKLFVGVGEDTGFEAGSFDLVTAATVHHELPPGIIRAMFAESYRLLRPGGDVLMADVPRYFDLTRIESWRFDWVAKYHGEPFWRASASMDLEQAMTAAGFVDVAAYPLNAKLGTYVFRGHKPA
jgi:SAM-dependent methyltransferase